MSKHILFKKIPKANTFKICKYFNIEFLFSYNMDTGELQYPRSSYQIDRRKTSTVSAKQYNYQPSNDIMKTPNLKHNKSQGSGLDTKSIENNSSSIGAGETSSTATGTIVSNENVGKVTKPRRNVTSLRSSLRRLLTITFSRSSSSSNTAQSNNNNNNNNNISNNNNNNNNSHNISKYDMDATSSQMTTSNRSSSKQQRDKSIFCQRKNRNSSTNSTPAISSSSPTTISPKTLSSSSSIVKERRIPLQETTIIGNGDTTNLSNIIRRRTNSENDKSMNELKLNQSPTTAQKSSVTGDSTQINGKTYIECPLCVLLVSESSTPNLEGCRHQVCLDCMQRYITTEINHSRLNITCPMCTEPIHPNIIKQILQNEKYYLKYESFMLRRVLAAEPDARWCPAPDCGYVVLANGCASCPKIVCGREGCNTSFCYHCKQEWHPNQTCSAASIQRNKRTLNAFTIGDLTEESTQNRKSSKSSQVPEIVQADDIKECPVCASRIIKMNDGSCNHMTCSICETEFCWLCMKEITDLHYFSPSGCTFWGKKPWSRKKKLLWQLGMLIGAPVCIILIAGIAVPAIVIGIPVWAARKLHSRLERKPFSRYRKNAILTGGVLLSFVVSPIISAVALAIGIPILLGYVYGVVPLSLCRSSGGCLSSASSLENLQQEMQASRSSGHRQTREENSIDTGMSNKLGETSSNMSNMSLETNSIGHVTIVEREDRESASNAALAGSIISGTAEDGNSTCALAGSIISKESGYTLIPSEVLYLNSSQNN